MVTPLDSTIEAAIASCAENTPHELLASLCVQILNEGVSPQVAQFIRPKNLTFLKEFRRSICRRRRRYGQRDSFAKLLEKFCDLIDGADLKKVAKNIFWEWNPLRSLRCGAFLRLLFVTSLCSGNCATADSLKRNSSTGLLRGRRFSLLIRRMSVGTSSDGDGDSN